MVDFSCLPDDIVGFYDEFQKSRLECPSAHDDAHDAHSVADVVAQL